jgi:predicted PurR-regulated permease PerM
MSDHDTSANAGIGPTKSPEGEAELTPAIRSAIEISIRLGAIALLVGACLMIIAPFMSIVVWALIIAIAADGVHARLSQWMGGRRALAASVLVIVALAVLLIPTVRLSETLISGAQAFAHDVSDGSVHIPPPDPRVEQWPIVGERLFEQWTLASENLQEALTPLVPQLQAVSRWLLAAAGSAGAGILQLAGSLLIAGVMLARGTERRAAGERFAMRMAGRERGKRLAALAYATVRSVVQGILGVAFIQAVMAGVGFIVAGVPAAGLWALLVLVSAVVQLPVAIAMVPPVLYAFSSIGGATAIALTVWCALIGLLDNVLKPMLFGRGVEVPAVVIFLGAIGGMLTMGILGLFLGSVVLALGFALFMAWLADEEAVEEIAEP